MLFEKVIETAQAAKARGHRHRQHRQIGIRQQVFGEGQTARLQIPNRRHAVLGPEGATQMSGRTAKPRGRLLQPLPASAGLLQHPRRPLHQAGGGVGDRGAGCELRPAQKARAVSGLFRLRGRRIKGAVFGFGQPGPAHRTAVDAGRGYPPKKRPSNRASFALKAAYRPLSFSIAPPPSSKCVHYGRGSETMLAVFGHAFIFMVCGRALKGNAFSNGFPALCAAASLIAKTSALRHNSAKGEWTSCSTAHPC